MPGCKGSNCKDVEVKVAAQEGFIYMMYREYRVQEGADSKPSSIIVSIYY